ncbi:intestinal mucin-like protein [Gambusia affinis]|uniref:intestinal mucin-like protein n=1 Tax=Gambusia affinis TaxID=33528 RepID=UPI001CDBE7C2|nr:intestinal mucin-like protein [Gambusia affinis]
MTSSVPEGTSRKSETTTISSKPSLHTTTTEGPVTSTQRATTESVETTFSETTVKIGTTNPSKVGTTGPVTGSITEVVESTTEVPGIISTSPETTLVTSKPSVVTKTTATPSRTTGAITTKASEASTTQGSSTNVGTRKPIEATSGQLTFSTTAIVEMTSSVPEGTSRKSETTTISSKPSLHTTTTEGPVTSTQRATTEYVETTFSETTVKIGTTNPSKVGTTGPVTGSITEVVESTTEVPGIISTSPETTLVTSKPSVVTKTTATPSRTTGAITTKASEASTTQGSSTNVGTRKPIEATSGQLTFSTTAIVEMTSSVPEGTSRKSETTTISSKPSLHTTTTEGPVTSTQRATTESVETTFSETTVKIGTTNPSKVGTTGPINVTVPLSTSRTSIPTPTTSSIFQSLPTHHRSTTSFFPSISTQVFPLRTTRVTIQTESPRISPLVTSSETTFAVITGQLHTSSVLTNPSIKITTGLTTESPVTATTVIAPMTKTLPGSTTIYPPTSTTHTTGATFPSTSQFTTASCVCNINGTSHLPGDLLYNVTDGLGWCYSAYCNASCKVETQSSPCPTTSMSSTTARSSTSLLSSTTKAPSSSSGPLTTVTTVASTATLECSDVYPPRKNGESWNTSNCTTATCVEGKVTVTATVCPNVTLPICTNGRKPVKIYEQNGCCFHYECECVCNVWSGSNYMTFDGQMYNFQQNCSYYLVKEIISKYNLTITRSNICDPSDSTFCPLALSVTYQSVKVVLTQVKTSGTPTNVVYVNQKRVYPAYSNSVMLLYGTDMEITAVIQDINTKIVYRGSSFSIDLPYSLFGGNTEGQCGTCDNSQANDCRSPNGQIESCSESAGLWTVPGTSCVSPSLPSVTATAQPLTSSSQHPNPTTQPTCKPAICELLMSSLFTPCHSFISPSPFVSSCTYEICNGGNDTCSSLEAYAAECSKAGVCIDWRSDTNGLCEHRCPNNKVYMACGPLVEPTCNDRYNKMFQADVTSSANYTQEGCFCPQGTTLFNTVYDTCVASCDCVGPDGKPKQPGETWTSECSSCECDQDSMSVRCEPVTCPEVQEPNCSEPGQQLTNTTQGCCTTQTCECNLNLCAGPSACPLGFQLHVSNRTCCPSYECVPKGVCVYDMTEFQPGTKIPTPQTITEAPLEEVSIAAAPSGTGGGGQEESFIPAACQECYCGPDTHPTTKLNVITCTPVVCHTNCSEGFEYQPAAGQCCGSCVQKSCILTTSGNNTVQIIEVNNTFVPPGDKCVQYTCEEINGQILMKETKTICPPFNPLDCEPETEKTDASGCCTTCRLQSVCQVESQQIRVEVNHCVSAMPVNVTSCVGNCRSSSMYSAAANSMMHQCECCQEATTSRKQVELTCADGSTLQHSYSHVESCRCRTETCSAGATTRAQRRRKR